MSYQIKFLRNEDFDSLPEEITRGSDISDSLGFYNPYNKSIYIRDTGYSKVNEYLMDHEISHIVEKEATDEDENGIRHKKFFKEMFLPFITGGLISGGQTGGVFNLGRKENKFDIGGLFGAKPQEPQDQGQSFLGSMNPFSMSAGSQGGGSQGGQSAGYSTYGNQDSSSFSGLNQSLNQNSQSNSFLSEQQRFQFGAPAGRTLTF